ncbi:MAG: hypothetical protein N3G22_03060 [Candidatus Micrarchaeota archaeon]|nr:hypothetical protein [Candidatus Micrarchaeota archaeon]
MAINLAGRVCESMFGPPLGTGANLFYLPFGVLGLGWASLVAVALLSSLMMLVLIHMFALAMRNQQIAVWSKFELYQVLATAVLVVFTTGAIVVGMCTFDMSFLGEGMTPNPYIDSATGNKLSMYQIVDKYFGRMEEIGALLFGYMTYVVKTLNFIAKVMWTASPIGVGSSETPLESLGQLNNLMFLMVSGYVVSYLLFLLQARMLEYLAVATLYYMYPFGVFFRAFEPTRLFGGTLIGLSIALFLFYPIIIVFNHYIMYAPMQDMESELKGSLSKANQPQNQLEIKYADREDEIKKEFEKLKNEGELGLFSGGISGSVLFLLKPVMFYFIGAVVLPVINFIVLVEITRGITRLYGDEIDITNLTRLI